MNYKKYKILKINFQSKKYIFENKNKVNKSKYKIKGYLFYIFDIKFEYILKQIVVLEEGYYRLNDEKMSYGEKWKQKIGDGTSCWKKIKKDRLEIFEKIKEGYQEIPKKLNSNQIKKINNLKITTLLNLEKFLTGSNSSGSDSNVYNSPLKTEFKNNFINFINVFKWSFANKKIKKSLESNFFDIENLNNNAINLEEFENLYLKKYINNKFWDYLKWFNPNIFLLEKGWDKIIKNLFVNIKTKNEKEFQKKYHEIDEKSRKISIKIYVDEFELNKINKKQLEVKLRSIFFRDLCLEHTIKGIKNSVEERDEFGNFEASHIIQVKNLMKNKEYFKISDHNNGLFLSPSLHTAFDGGQINLLYKNESFFMENNETKIKYKINDNILNNKRRKHLNSLIK